MNKNNNKGSNTRRASTANYIRLIYNTIHIFYRYTKWTNGVSCVGIVASQPTCCIVGGQTFLVLFLNTTKARHRQYGGIPVRPRLIAVSGIITNQTRHQCAPQVASTPLNAQNAKLVMFELNNGISVVKRHPDLPKPKLDKAKFSISPEQRRIKEKRMWSCVHILLSAYYICII